MSEKKTQQDYDKKWIDKNREHKRYLSARSSARSFIRNHAKMADLQELKNIIENKEMGIMKNTIKQITEGYKVDGENEKYIEFYESYEAIEQEGALSKIEASLDIGQTVEGLQYPVIFFDDSNADSGQLYEASQVDDVLAAASEYFEAK